ncbi:uncharacterized protein BDR25DRAFT_350771 [Lindgomyces ingoldianus]|uniref:Uncharacterized protein n=1 Tax=Lindgomyces ingoldianus TaxID=673940 RepID=A0ACB6R891_9PLEO|nr:uncharacterized protein BDR25DRAFT_350771 [Lindgomyces ingoldianus]KAF2475396.1 hypothetical protein BDR25DRAFT_350771 [Lindgomyces ingoldianus]
MSKISKIWCVRASGQENDRTLSLLLIYIVRAGINLPPSRHIRVKDTSKEFSRDKSESLNNLKNDRTLRIVESFQCIQRRQEVILQEAPCGIQSPLHPQWHINAPVSSSSMGSDVALDGRIFILRIIFPCSKLQNGAESVLLGLLVGDLGSSFLAWSLYSPARLSSTSADSTSKPTSSRATCYSTSFFAAKTAPLEPPPIPPLLRPPFIPQLKLPLLMLNIFGVRGILWGILPVLLLLPIVPRPPDELAAMPLTLPPTGHTNLLESDGLVICHRPDLHPCHLPVPSFLVSSREIGYPLPLRYMLRLRKLIYARLALRLRFCGVNVYIWQADESEEGLYLRSEDLRGDGLHIWQWPGAWSTVLNFRYHRVFRLSFFLFSTPYLLPSFPKHGFYWVCTKYSNKPRSALHSCHLATNPKLTRALMILHIEVNPLQDF